MLRGRVDPGNRPSVWVLILLLLALLGISLVHEREPDAVADVRDRPWRTPGQATGYAGEFAGSGAESLPPEPSREEVKTDGGP